MTNELIRRRTAISGWLVAAGLALAPMLLPQAGYAAASGSITVAIGAEPATMLPRSACSYETNFVTDNVYERLTRRQPDGSVAGWLAESYTQVDPLTWRFKLRPGISFTDGEPLNADAVIATVNYYMDTKNPSRCYGDYSTITGVKKVDDSTVDLTTTTPDPTVPSRLLKMYVIAPKWLTTTPDDQAATTAVGTGPYQLSEWVKGDHITLTANPQYWGDPKPTIGTIHIVTRGEASVRASMVQTGEADVAINISKDQATALPKSVTEHTTEAVFVRLNTLNPILKDPKVRQAIAESIDTDQIMQALFPGVSTSLNGQIIRPSALGFNPDLKPYPTDPTQAASLVKEAGAAGQKLDLIVRTDLIPNVSELGEALQGMIQSTGLVVNIVPMEAAPWRNLLFANKEGQQRTDMMIISASNVQFDSSRVINFYFGTGQFSQADSQSFQAEIDKTAALTGAARAASYQAMWKEIQDNYWVIPLFGTDYIHGLSARVNWTPRDDGFVYFNTFTLSQ